VSNPHSNGDVFSRSSSNFFEIRVVNNIMVADRRMVTIININII